jgi:hypothetical protein
MRGHYDIFAKLRTGSHTNFENCFNNRLPNCRLVEEKYVERKIVKSKAILVTGHGGL